MNTSVRIVEKLYNLMWSMADEKIKTAIHEEYKSVCPSHIPFWKYFIYSYSIAPTFERKIALRKIESMDDLLRLVSKDASKLVSQIKEDMENFQIPRDKLNKEIKMDIETTQLKQI